MSEVLLTDSKVLIKNDELKEEKEENIDAVRIDKKKNKKKKKAEEITTDVKDSKKKPVDSKSAPKSKKQAAQAKLVKRLQEATLEAERLKKEQEEMEKQLEDERVKELERIRLEEARKAHKKQKEKERKQRLKQDGKLLSRSEKEKKSKNKEILQRMLQQGAVVSALQKEEENQPRYAKHQSNESLESDKNIKKNELALESTPETDSNKSNLSKENHTHDLEASEIVKPTVEVASWENIDYSKVDSNSQYTISSEDKLVSEASKSHPLKPIIADAELRIKTRREENKMNISFDKLRSPIICVMGHVDTGKTKILDKLRNTHVQDGEAGGITQQIGVTNVPLSAISQSVSICESMKNFEYKIRGLSIIDTPGHFSFRNLRNLGSSLCDIAILIVDIMHSIEPQTEESIRLLREKRVPFVVALNKIDVLVEWKSIPGKNIKDMLDLQTKRTKAHFEELYRNTFTKFAEHGLNVALFYENTDPKKVISVIPTSAKTGDGIGDLIAHICKYSQTYLYKKLALTNEVEATIMEVKVIPGLGSTIDVILVNGTLSKGDKIILAGLEGPIVSQIRALLTPQPMKEMRVKGTYVNHEKISVTQGVKISGPNLDNAMAGLPLYVAEYDDEIEIYKKEISSLIHKTLSSFDKKEKGVYVSASTLGSLEALLNFLTESKIPYFGMNIGPVHKRDVISAMTMLEHNPLYAVILAFDVKIDPDAQQMADKSGIKIFTANIIYHLFDAYIEYQKAYKKKKADEFRHLTVFPCILKILPEHVYKTRDPIVVGVSVEDGSARVGTPLCVPSKNNIIIGSIVGIELNHKSIDMAKKGQEVCIKIMPVGEETPKLLGRHFEVEDQLVSKITRDSIDLLKEYYRDELSKSDWILIKNLKNTFAIL